MVSDALGQPVSITEPHPEVPGEAADADARREHPAAQPKTCSARSARVFEPKDATAIVMDPRTGAVLALANWPQVNANDLGDASPEALEDRAVSFDYEPGSTFKVVTVSGALQQGLITPSTPFNIPDQIQVADRTIHDDTEHPEETLTTAQILARSSNVGAIKIGDARGRRTLQRAGCTASASACPTGVDLPGEEPGVTLAARTVLGLLDGQPADRPGRARDADADGERLRGDRQRRHPAPAAHRRVDRRARRSRVPAGHRDHLERRPRPSCATCSRACSAPGGTASEVSIPGYQLAGKTGTASKVDPATGEYSKSAYVASFIGFAPASDPKLLCAVVVDEPQAGSIFGGTVAAPAFGQIMSFALPYLGIAPGLALGSSGGGN